MSRHSFTLILASLLALSICDFGVTSPVASICSVVWTPSTAHDIFDDILNKSDYKKDVRPVNQSTPADPTTGVIPTKVEINYYVYHIDNIDESNGAYQAQFIFRQKWTDPRLAYANTPQYLNKCNSNRPSSLLVPDSMFDQVWTPDLFIKQELYAKLHEMFHPNRYFKVSPNGEVLFSQRITLTLACPELARLELTKKECDMKVESYGYLDDELSLEWKEEEPIYMAKDIFTPRPYKLEKVTPLRCDTTHSGKTWSCIKGKFSFSKGDKN